MSDLNVTLNSGTGQTGIISQPNTDNTVKVTVNQSRSISGSTSESTDSFTLKNTTLPLRSAILQATDVIVPPNIDLSGAVLVFDQATQLFTLQQFVETTTVTDAQGVTETKLVLNGGDGF